MVAIEDAQRGHVSGFLLVFALPALLEPVYRMHVHLGGSPQPPAPGAGQSQVSLAKAFAQRRPSDLA